MNAIVGAGGYVPPWRIEATEIADHWGSFDAKGIDRTAVAAPDEDALTMAYEAARNALSSVPVDAADVSFLAVGTTTPPLAEEEWQVNLAAMLGVPETATTHRFTGSTRAGTRALTVGLDAALSDGVGVVVASDCPRGRPGSRHEHAAGAGAAAFVLHADGPVDVVETAEYAQYRPGTRFRPADGEYVEGLDSRQYDRDAFVETIRGATEGLDENVYDAVVIQAPDGSRPYRIARALDVDQDAVTQFLTVDELGDLGAASMPLSLALALQVEDSVLAVSFGSGAGADAFRVDTRGSVPAELDISEARPLTFGEYMRFRGELSRPPVPGGGAHVSVPSWLRSIPARYRLEAGRCTDCDAVTFPPEGACDECGVLDAFEPVNLDRTGTVETVTTISSGGAPPEFTTQQSRSGDYQIAIVCFETHDGTDASIPVQVVRTASDVAIGDPVEWTIRRLYTQEGVTRYGGKVRPV